MSAEFGIATSGARQKEVPKAGVTILEGRPVASTRFHWVVVLLCSWFVCGAYLDAWAHNNIARLETFFTPWHGVLYSGAAATMLFIAYTHFRNKLKGYAFRRALPEGYGLALVGLVGFAVGGVGDMLWHTAFGIERSVEAAISPTHLLLLCAGLLVVSGPLRAGWRRAKTNPPQTLTQWGPIILSLTLTLMWLMTLPQVLHPLINVYASNQALSESPALRGYLGQVLGAASILINTGVLMGVLLLAIRRWQLPRGAFSFIFAVYAIGLTAMNQEWRFIPGIITTGVIADGLYTLLKPSLERPVFVQIFAFCVPFVFYLLYFATVALTGGMWWRIHMWLGISVIAGALGVGLSFLLLSSWQSAEA